MDMDMDIDNEYKRRVHENMRRIANEPDDDDDDEDWNDSIAPTNMLRLKTLFYALYDQDTEYPFPEYERGKRVRLDATEMRHLRRMLTDGNVARLRQWINDKGDTTTMYYYATLKSLAAYIKRPQALLTKLSNKSKKLRHKYEIQKYSGKRIRGSQVGTFRKWTVIQQTLQDVITNGDQGEDGGTYKQHIRVLLARFLLAQPPLRREPFIDARFADDDGGDDPDSNRIVFNNNENRYEFHIGKDKQAHRRGYKNKKNSIVEIDPSLTPYIQDSSRRFPRDYLFADRVFLTSPMKTHVYDAFVEEVSGVRTNNLRAAYATHWMDTHPGIQSDDPALVDLARRMRTSVSMLERVYAKSLEKIDNGQLVWMRAHDMYNERRKRRRTNIDEKYLD